MGECRKRRGGGGPGSGPAAGALAGMLGLLARGFTVAGAARVAGVAVSSAYWLRRRDPLFAFGWEAALRLSDAGRTAGAPAPAPTAVRVQAGDRLIRVRRRPHEFDRARKEAFLGRFAACCNFAEAARHAGVAPGTAYRHLRGDPDFANAFDEVLPLARANVEAELLRERLAEQAAYRIAPEGAAIPEGQSFERSLKLLAEYNRGFGRVGRRPVEARLTKWSFEKGFEALEKRLRAFGLRIARGEGPPEEAIG